MNFFIGTFKRFDNILRKKIFWDFSHVSTKDYSRSYKLFLTGELAEIFENKLPQKHLLDSHEKYNTPATHSFFRSTILKPF